jgi:hypothetical protein
MKQLIRTALLIVTAFWAAHVRATGYYGPDQYLDRGGANVDASPEFYWDLETKRLSRAFHPAEKLVETGNEQKEAENIDSAARNATKSEATAGVDVKDYAAALDQAARPAEGLAATRSRAKIYRADRRQNHRPVARRIRV